MKIEQGFWDWDRAVYGEDPENEREGEDEDDTNFTFDSSGGTMHMDVSLETKGIYPADAPDFKRAIAVANEGSVNGWDFLWFKYEDEVSEEKKNLVKKPVAVYVEKVYERKNFALLKG